MTISNAAPKWGAIFATLFLNAAPTQKRVRNEDAAIYNGIVNITARWTGQNYEAALDLAGGSLVLARFFFASFLFIMLTLSYSGPALIYNSLRACPDV